MVLSYETIIIKFGFDYNRQEIYGYNYFTGSECNITSMNFMGKLIILRGTILFYGQLFYRLCHNFTGMDII